MLDTHTYTQTRVFAHANNQSQGESKLITVNDGQVDAETFLK